MCGLLLFGQQFIRKTGILEMLNGLPHPSRKYSRFELSISYREITRRHNDDEVGSAFIY